MGFLDLFWPRCPDCGKRGLRSHSTKGIAEAMKRGGTANPAWFWYKCPMCDGRFKRKHYGSDDLLAATDEEWREMVVDNDP